MRPRASTRKAKEMPGKRSNQLNWIGPDFNTTGEMDKTVKHRTTLPKIVQLSLKFGRFPAIRINRDTRAGHRMAHNGR